MTFHAFGLKINRNVKDKKSMTKEENNGPTLATAILAGILPGEREAEAEDGRSVAMKIDYNITTVAFPVNTP